jgi:hypothetical protein
MDINPVTHLEKEIAELHRILGFHPLYSAIKQKSDLESFMKTHVFAVWDFMSLLKRLQRDLTCVTVPWYPSKHPKEIVRFINQIVLGEESDIDDQQQPIDHFSLYLAAMNEAGISTEPIMNFLETKDLASLQRPVADFVSFNLKIAMEAPLHVVAAVFFYGREKLIPGMFEGILKEIWKSDSSAYPKLKYYIERHIEVDGSEHSVLALGCLDYLCKNDTALKIEALMMGKVALQYRYKLWDHVLSQLRGPSVSHYNLLSH